MAAQLERLQALAVATGRMNVEVVLDEGVSAKTLNRSGLASVLERVRQGLIEAIVVLKLDRLTRDIGDLNALLKLFDKTDTALVSVTESLDTSTAGGRMVINMLGVLAQWERETIGERTSFALAHKRRNLEVYGHPPFGYRRDDRFLVPDDKEQDALKQLQAMSAAGVSLRKCGAWLEAHGFVPRRGYKWHAQSVKEILTSKMASAA